MRTCFKTAKWSSWLGMTLLGAVCFLASGCTPKTAEVPTAPDAAESSAQIVTLSSETFEDFIQSEDKVLVDFWATWCPPCRAQGELLHKMEEAGTLPATARVGKVDIDAEPELASRFHVESIPTLLIFQKGELITTFVGLQDEATLTEALQ